MASIFLSYGHSDVSKARTIAALLERHGHQVWWDRFIRGGTQYSKEIERELRSADAVVVLWSRESVDSAWVRDEAAAGRDSGRLVPITIDGTEPPLGFRQFQSIDLAARRIDSGKRKALLNAIEGLAGTVADPTSDRRHGHSASSSPSRYRFPLRMKILVLAVAAIAVVLVIILQPWRSASGAPSVAVAAAEPGPAAESLAADLLIKLGVLQSSHSDALQLVEAGSPQRPDFTIKVGSVKLGNEPQASLMLVHNRGGTLLWSGEFSAPSGKPADLRQQMAYSAATVLECAVEALTAKVDLATLKLYLSGCANLSSLLALDPAAAGSIFEKVAEAAPKFEGAWKKLILADIRALGVSGRNNPPLRRNLQQRISEARRLHPQLPEIFLAESWLQPPRPLSGWLNQVERALAAEPDNPDILAFDSRVKANVGLMQDSIVSTRHAVRSDPLSSSARDSLITALLNGGQVDAAREELKKLEQLWPGATNVLQARFAIEFRVGDAAKALKIMRSGQLGPAFTPTSAAAWSAHESYLLARMAPTATNKQRAIANARAFYAQNPAFSWVVARALSEFGDLDELIAFLQSSDASVPPNTTWTMFRTTFAPLHRDPRFMQVADRFGLIDYWTESGKWPDFCADPAIRYDCRTEAAKLRR